MNVDCYWLHTRMAHVVLLTTSVTDVFSILLCPVQKLFMYIKSAYKKKKKKKSKKNSRNKIKCIM